MIINNLTYIQRKSNVASILWILGCGLGMTHYPVKKVYLGANIGNTIWLTRDEEGFLCADKTTRLEQMVNSFQTKIIKGPNHVFRVRKIFEQRAKKLAAFIIKLKQMEFKKYSNRQLWANYYKVFSAYKDVYPYGEQLVIAVGDLSEKIQPKFARKGINDEQYNTLISSFELSFLQRERRDLLKIALLSQNKISPVVLKKIKEHTDKYTWLPYDYGVKIFQQDDFLAELKKIIKKGARYIKKNLEHLNKYAYRIKTDQNKISKSYVLSAHEQKLLEIVRTS
ncbi:hypothetical protein COT27_01565 [Candidatus Kuenenbacteria bacterium CG08_land_8_20_14_0_20_37_23]|uniref:Uncharacterized protein n=1 Tax=Candidatus Kuenenbacteria bacterium CG08_land_8_20_14_0_20_37_23 TaxID=1974617 RepID=A0A2M6XSY2_9BACT|nr:MAG: hypothetical protein COT27_01565 [Candidatus Kuenenbacteria bacterium CG08_land_8_20_14_0_20_37_23]